jgi:hypothetical protein
MAKCHNNKEKLKKLFESIDINKDKKIDKGELKVIFGEREVRDNALESIIKQEASNTMSLTSLSPNMTLSSPLSIFLSLLMSIDSNNFLSFSLLL